MPRFNCGDPLGYPSYATQATSAREAAEEYVSDLDFAQEHTRWIDVEVTDEHDQTEIHTIVVDPDEPGCARILDDGTRWSSRGNVYRHDWQQSSAWGSGAGVITVEHCPHCECARLTQTLADDGHGGQGTSLSYETKAEREETV